ncbi:hypothetical protein U6A24_05610 [Aquimarina gracilis]|uniref:UbiA prenyltransferase family protein n=1 Tax=Aquimarina gracilis TaxID=874422 RepID=A0ABU5ZUK3_9FLAO|nr:hypothetical protein [Aquimarina gracilis]MEB3344926.1 hypothetical protein [Aquimarina gracilis]
METLKSIFRFYVNSSIHVALAISALVSVTFIKFEVTNGNMFLFLSFLGSIAAYNFVKYSNVSKLYHKRLARSMKGIRFLTWFSLALFMYFAFKMSLKTLLYMFPFIVLTILYVVPVFPNKSNLRNIAGVKIFIIAVVWTGITVVVPVIYAEANMNFDFLIETIQRFLFIIVMMLPFEIRDLEYDSSSLETIPQTIGITRTKVFGSILLVVFLLLTAVKELLSSVEILSTILVTTISLLFLWGTEKEQSKYYCSFWVESVPIMWLIILVVLQNLFS